MNPPTTPKPIRAAGVCGTAAQGPSGSCSFFHSSVPVQENFQLARDTFLIRLHCPKLAASIRPGQFLMIRAPHRTDPLLGRPFALYDTVVDRAGKAVAIDVVYLVIGKLTRLLSELKAGDMLEVWGPLGNGFPDLTGLDHVALVAGGIGQTPFLAHIRDLLGQRGYGGQPAQKKVQHVSLYYGVRSADLAAGLDDFRAAGATLHLASDDGSLGYHGFVTGLLENHLNESDPSPAVPPPQHLVGCGPEPMLKVLSALAAHRQLPCHLSLETPMACGIGVCFSCVTPVKTATGWDYKRVCIDGPVFDAATLAWEAHG